jgi:hypothetical protein
MELCARRLGHSARLLLGKIPKLDFLKAFKSTCRTNSLLAAHQGRGPFGSTVLYADGVQA